MICNGFHFRLQRIIFEKGVENLTGSAEKGEKKAQNSLWVLSRKEIKFSRNFNLNITSVQIVPFVLDNFLQIDSFFSLLSSKIFTAETAYFNDNFNL